METDPPPSIDPALASALDAMATRIERNVSLAFDKRFESFDRRLKFVEKEVLASFRPAPTSTPPTDVTADLPQVLFPSGELAKPPTLAHRTGDLERKVDRLLKAHGLQPPEMGAVERIARSLASAEGRKQIVALIAAIAAIAAALQRTPAHAPPAPPSLPSSDAAR